MSKELVEKARANARQNFRDGLNCSESVFKAVLDTGITDFPAETVAISTGFGGGMGLAGHNCGALIGRLWRRRCMDGEILWGEFRTGWTAFTVTRVVPFV